MNSKYIRLSILLLCLLSINSFAQNELKGKITDKSGAKAIPFANIYIEDLKIGALCDIEGNYILKQLPEGTYLISARALGYEAKSDLVKIKGATTHDFTLSVSEVEEQEVVVTGTSGARSAKNTPQSVIEVPNSYLQQNASTNIIDAISRVPGVSAITDGQSISKPVIRGLGYNRVVTINDGVRQEGQQWGDEFGIEIDPFSVDRVEILKGPASLMYGSDAISGVINFLPEKTLPEGQVKGDVNLGYQTNNGLIGTSAHIAGNLKGITFSARVDNTMAHAYQNQVDGYVFNTQFSNLNYDGTVGIHRKWGYSQIHYSHFELRTGIAEGVKNEQGTFLKAYDSSGYQSDLEVTKDELKSYTPFVIHQLVKHDKLVWDNSLAIGEGRLIGRFAMQTNSRQENNDITMANTSNIWYDLSTYNYDLRYVSPTWKGFDFSVGANGMYQNSKNKGTLLLIPEYDLFDLGAFAIANKQMGKLYLSAGLRYDTRKFKGHDDYIDSSGNQLEASDPAAIHRFAAYNSDFNGLSASLGATYNATEKCYIKANIASGFRAPNVAESGSNGIHDGTVIYEIGQPNLKAEQSMQVDITPGFKSKDVTAELSVFYSSITNFIATHQLSSVLGGDSVNNSTPGFDSARVFLYSQSDATVSGGEFMLDVHPSGLKWLDWYTAYSVANVTLKNVVDNEKYMPFTPPAALRSEVTVTVKKLNNWLDNTYFRFGVVHCFEQTNVYKPASAYAGVPDDVPVTPAYTLLNAGLGSDFVFNKRKAFSLYLCANNLANTNYIDYMSRFRYNSNTVNGVTQQGVSNMGRNFCIKLIVPFSIKK